MPAALALPSGAGPHPGVIVLHEIFGLNDDIRRIAARFADNGYVALAPNLYAAGNRLACLSRTMVALVRGADGGTVRTIEAARRHLAARPDVDADRIGVVGFCMGGGFALAFAATGRVAVAGVNYGAVPAHRDQLADVCPVVASYGALDRTMQAMPGRLERHLEALGVPHDIKVYEGAGHSFFSQGGAPGWLERIPLPNPTHAGYQPEAAEDGWRRMLTFFAEHLGTPAAP